MGVEMTWLDHLLSEDAGGTASTPSPAVEARSLFDPTLEALCSGLPQEDAQALREERAAILEHQAGMSREEAEHRAFPKQKKSPPLAA